MGFSASTRDDNPAVFGTFGVQYDISEFDREREDGFSILGMVPDCRVFIYGAELTKDIKDVNITNSLANGNTCEITLQNPRGRYEITKQDLMGKWREDKDILLTYDYEHFNRISARAKENFMDKITPSVFGRKTADQIKNGLNKATEFKSTFIPPYGAPKVRGITRQIFETKYHSGLSKYTGDVVFDYKDPVFVFFKGRFSPLWYFGFTGIITGWDDNDTYGQGSVVKLKCEDITAIWKRAKLNKQGAMFAFSRGEDRIRTTSKGSAFNITEDIAGAFNFSDMIKMAVYGYDFAKAVYNCHASRPGKYEEDEFKGPQEDFLANSDAYKKARRELQSGALIDSGLPTVGVGQTDSKSGNYMFTRADPWESGGFGADTSGHFGSKKFGGNSGASTSKNDGLIDISKIKYLYPNIANLGTQTYQLNDAQFGPSASIYLQLNEIEFPENVKFNGENVKAFLDISVRYWEAQHRIAETVPALTSNTTHLKGTGWEDNKAFGIAGIHPALTYEFISNFNVLGNIWEQCHSRKDVLQDLILTPNDKIRAMVGGMPTEMVPNDSSTTEPTGTAFNFFRPRLFILLPRRFSDRYKKAAGTKPAKFENLFTLSQTSIYEFLKEKLKGVEYILYASPSGDIFVEPELYDFHPLEFSSRIDDRNIVKKKLGVKFKAKTGNEETPIDRTDNAYFFDPKANHPFFIMEKDRFRVTQTFDHKSIHTEVTVHGGVTPAGGLQEIFETKFQDTIADISASNQFRGADLKNNIASGKYIADGFQKQLDPNGEISKIRKQYEESLSILNSKLLEHMYKKDGKRTVQSMLKDYITNMISIYEKGKDSTKLQQEDYGLFWENALSIRKELVEKNGNYKNTPSSADIDMVLALFFKNLHDYKISDSFNNIVKVLIDKKDKKAAEAKMSTNNSAMRKALNGAESYELVEATALIRNLTPASNTGGPAAAVFELVSIGLINYKDDTDIKPMYDGMLQHYISFVQKGGGGKGILIRNIAEERLAAQKGMYDPRFDMVKHYGFNPKDPIKNTFIKSGIEAYEYARTVFNRLKGKAFQLNLDVIGRPEFCLNRPYYCERKDSIGLLTKYTLIYSYGDSFRSNVNLEYVRKNSIVYDYSLGELDDFSSKGDYNKMFLKQANLYYQLNKGTSSLLGKTTSALTDAVAGASPGELRSAASSAVGGLANKVGSSFIPPGGIFVAHDRIGHIPFDTRFGESDPVSVVTVDRNVIKKSINENVKYADQIPGLYQLSLLIKQALSERTKKEKREENINKKEKQRIEQAIIKAEGERDQIDKQRKNTGLSQKQRVELAYKYKAKYEEVERKKKEKVNLESELKKIKDDILNYNKKLYGSYEKIDIGKEIPKAFATLLDITPKSGDVSGSMGSKAKETNISAGLFYKLFELYVYATATILIYDVWEIFEEKQPMPTQTFDSYGTTTFYITVKPGISPEKLKNTNVKYI